MGSRLRDMIRAIRACKTAAEERAVVKKECAAIRTSFNESDQDYYRHRNLAKLMFIHMLGYPTHFGQMECLKLIAYTGFPEKRIGYLGLMILLDERQEVLMLVTNSLKNDLNHTNQFICGLALCALGNICSAEMARDLATEVEKLLQSNISYIKKKAALCAVRIVRKVPDLAENFMQHATKLLSDKPHGVLVAGVKLCTELCIFSPVALKHFRKQTPSLVRILKNIVTSGYAPEYDVGGITDPFLQIRILRLLRLVGHEDTNASDAMSDVLAQVATNTESNKNAGNAILYACVRTIMDIEDVGGLRVLAVNILGRFLSNRDNNIRYVALTTLMKVVGVDNQAVQRHRSTILECVKDTDISIRRRALDLVYALVNESNAKMLTKELVDHLKSSDPEFKAELTDKFCLIVDKFSPDKLWYIDQMVNVLAEAGKYVTNEVVHTFLVVISNALDLQGYAVRSLYRCFQHWNGEESLAKVAAWCIGEYGDMLVNNTGLLDLEKPLVVAEADLVDVVETVLKDHRMSFETQAIALIALLKLSSRLPGCIERIKGLVLQNKRSFALELQQRSIEFSSILVKHDNLKATLVERMPVLDEAAFSAKRSDGTRAGSGGSMNIISGIPAATLSNGSAKPSTNTLVDLLDLSTNDSPALPPQSAGDLLQDLLGVEPSLFSTNIANSAQGSSGGSNILLDLLSLGPTPTATSEIAGISSSLSGPMLTTQNSFTANVDPLAMLGTSIPVLSQSAPMSASTSQKPISTETANGTLDTRLQSISPEPVIDLLADLNANVPTIIATEPAKYPSIIAYQSKALKVSFDFSKSTGKPQMTQIKATFTNLTSTQFTDFIFQAAVPKFMQLHLDPASGSLLPPTGSGVINQSLTVTNTLQGQKNLVMKIRIGYKINGQEVLEQGQASNFPSGL